MKTKSLLANCVALMSRHPFIMLTGAAIGLSVASVYLYTTPPLFESSASIEYPSKEASYNTIINTATPATEEITSPEFIAMAIKDKVNPISYYVTQDYKKKNNTYSFPFEVSYKTTGTKFQEQEYIINQTSETNFTLISNAYSITRYKNGTFGEELIDGDLALTITKKKTTPYLAESLIQPATFSFKVQSAHSIAAGLMKQNNLEASENNNVLKVTCRNENAEKAKQITDAITTHFLRTRGDQVPVTESGMTNIDYQLELLSGQLQQTEEQIAEYKRQNNITDLNFDTQKTLGILKDLQLQKTQLELTRAALDNTSKYLRKNRDINNSSVEYGAINDPVFSEQLTALNAKYESKAKGTADANVDSEIETLKTLIAERILNTRKKTAIQLNKINSDIVSVQEQLNTLPEKANILTSLDRKLSLDKKVYDLLVEKRAQALVTGTGIPTGGKILKPASQPKTPVTPISWVVLAIGFLGGLIIATPLTYILDKMKSSRITRRQQLDEQTRIPFIGSINAINEQNKVANPSISTLCTRVLMAPQTKLITFASINKGVGKTFIATHFAQAFAAMDKKVLVLDMNHENPGVSTSFNVTPERSLADVLAGSCDIHDAICLTSYPNLDVLECGELDAGINSLLASKKQSAIIEDLKKHYDLIVTDTPDSGTQIDAIPLMKMSDLNLFVVRSNTTRKTSLVAAEQIKQDYNIQNLFFLLNTVSSSFRNNSDSSRKSRVRKLNSQSENAKTSYVPEVLRKIALWFY